MQIWLQVFPAYSLVRYIYIEQTRRTLDWYNASVKFNADFIILYLYATFILNIHILSITLANGLTINENSHTGDFPIKKYLQYLIRFVLRVTIDIS